MGRFHRGFKSALLHFVVWVSVLMMTGVVSVSSNIFDLIRAEFDAPYEIGSWFLVSNDKIIRAHDGRLFSRNVGLHPIVIKTKYNPGRHGPNVSGYPRSSTITSEFKHSAHKHHDGQIICSINKDGWVKLHIPVVISSSEISADTFSCYEEKDSELMRKIGITL